MGSSHLRVNSINTVYRKSEYFKNSFILNVINEWNKLDPDISSFSSYNLFSNALSKFIRPVQRKTFNFNYSVRTRLLACFRLGFSQVREQKFRHGIRDIFNLLFPCSTEAATTTYYFLLFHFYNANRCALINDLKESESSFSTLNENKFINLNFFGSNKLDDKKCQNILMCTIKFIKDC